MGRGTPSIRRAVAEGLSIFHVLNPGAYGGLESVVEMLARGHTRRGHRITLVTLVEDDGEPHAYEEAMRGHGLKVESVRSGGRAYLQERRSLAAVLAAGRPDIVHSHGYRADVQVGGAVRKLGLRGVSTAHGFLRGDWKNRFYEWLEEREWRRTHSVVAVSRPLEARLFEIGVDPERVIYLPNAWTGDGHETLSRAAAREVLGLPNERRVVGWVGRFSPEKGPDVLLEALARSRAQSDGRTDYRLCYVGDGPLLEAVRARAAALGLSDAVHFAGVQPKAGRLFRAFDAFALSSRSEGTPIALFEAMAAEVPIVATRVGGVPDVIEAAHAHIVDPEDPAAFATALDDVLGDADSARTRAAAAQERLATAYDVEAWLERYEAIYAETIGRSA